MLGARARIHAGLRKGLVAGTTLIGMRAVFDAPFNGLGATMGASLKFSMSSVILHSVTELGGEVLGELIGNDIHIGFCI